MIRGAACTACTCRQVAVIRVARTLDAPGEASLGGLATSRDLTPTGRDALGLRRAGGEGPLLAEIAPCCGRDEKAAIKTAHKYFRWSVAGWPVLAELPHEEAFEAASKHVSPDIAAEKISCGPDAARHLKAITEYVAVGCDHIVLNRIGPDQEFFFKFFAEKLAPSLRARRKSARR
ncbi:MAG: hypothetical protein K9G48_13980 [Reyranella sp.]|nr:hypothetical protein [Reyranella sp.]